jgi:hypothetical protein
MRDSTTSFFILADGIVELDLRTIVSLLNPIETRENRYIEM